MRLCTQRPAYSATRVLSDVCTQAGRTRAALGPRIVGVARPGPERLAIIAAWYAHPVWKPHGLDSSSPFAAAGDAGSPRQPSEARVSRALLLWPMRNWAVDAARCSGHALRSHDPVGPSAAWPLQLPLRAAAHTLRSAPARGGRRERRSPPWRTCFRTKQLVQRAGHDDAPSRGAAVLMPAPSPPEPIARGTPPSKLASNATLGQPRGSSSTCR